MVNAAMSYYGVRKDRLPKETDEVVSITTGTLIEAELLEEIKDPNDNSKTCQGNVKIKKVDNDYVYTPFLKCEGNYEPEYLSEIVKKSKVDEYGNGVYLLNNEYVYRGDYVDNYVMFASKLWRIIMVDSNDDIELVLNDRTKEKYTWDTSFNVIEQKDIGVNTDYFNSDIRKSLISYYNEQFTKEEKSKIVKKDLCIGKVNENEDFNRDKECEKKQENEYIGLLRISDYQRASLDETCTKISDGQCKNRNYMIKTADIDSWFLNADEENTYKVYKGLTISTYTVSKSSRINPVIYLSKEVIVLEGNGTLESPFVIKE